MVIREEGGGFKDNAGTVGFFLGGGTFKLNSKREIYIYILDCGCLMSHHSCYTFQLLSHNCIGYTLSLNHYMLIYRISKRT